MKPFGEAALLLIKVLHPFSLLSKILIPHRLSFILYFFELLVFIFFLNGQILVKLFLLLIVFVIKISLLFCFQLNNVQACIPEAIVLHCCVFLLSLIKRIVPLFVQGLHLFFMVHKLLIYLLFKLDARFHVELILQEQLF